MINAINSSLLKKESIKALKASFNNAKPCRHLIIENFLSENVATALYENFPSIKKLNVKRKSINEKKSEDYHFERFAPVFTDVRNALNSNEFYSLMQEITGINGLFSTLDAMGSGLHQGENGSFVDVHVDFNMHTEKNLERRINLLIYLNKYWKNEYGGNLELWDKEMIKCHHSIPPSFNTAVIFETDDNSPHGYSKINIPENESRKSFYCYYYTPLRKDFVYRDSKFIPRPNEGILKKSIVNIKETIKVKLKRALKLIGFKNLDFQDKNK